MPPATFTRLAFERLRNDPVAALANFTWINNVTLGAAFCRFAWSGDHHCLARHMGLPFSAISVEGDDPALVRGLAAELLEPGQAAYTLAPLSIAAVLHDAVQVVDARPEWQMLFRGDPAGLDPGPARRLTAEDLPAMLALAASDEVMVFGPDTFARGAFFGIFAGDELVAMGGVQNELPGMSEIGSIVTHPQHRRRGYGAQVVAALVQQLSASGQQVFLCLFQTNHIARSLYEKLGFQTINDLVLLSWRLSS